MLMTKENAVQHTRARSRMPSLPAFRGVSTAEGNTYFPHRVRPSIRLSTCIAATPTELICVKFATGVLYENLHRSRKFCERWNKGIGKVLCLAGDIQSLWKGSRKVKGIKLLREPTKYNQCKRTARLPCTHSLSCSYNFMTLLGGTNFQTRTTFKNTNLRVGSRNWNNSV
jgi:hypothetical protein